MHVPFLDLTPTDCEEDRAVEAALTRALRSGTYVLGPEAAAFEAEFAAWLGAVEGSVVGVGNGFDALHLSLRALRLHHNLPEGAGVVLPALTCVHTIAAVAASGLHPVLADVDPETLLLSAETVRAVWNADCRVVLPVHLYGAPCPPLAIEDALVLEDCAQAHGARWGDTPCGLRGTLGAFSFYPTKNLGAVGDGGAVVDPGGTFRDTLRALRNYGEDRRYHSVVQGYNSRLDEVQAAVLRARLPFVDSANARRRALAARYDAAFDSLPLRRTRLPSAATAVHHLYVVRTPRREALRAHLNDAGIGTAMHYPTPLHLQPAYATLGYAAGAFPVAEAAAREVFSLPLHPRLSDAAVDAVIAAVGAFFASRSNLV
mgnify:CR=1 FL=1